MLRMQPPLRPVRDQTASRFSRAPLLFSSIPFLLWCLLAGWPATADALGRRPPASDKQASDNTPTRWGLGSCEEIANALDAQIQTFLHERVWRHPTTMGGYIFKLQGTEPFGICSEFFNYLVVEGLYPFKQDAFAQDCTTMVQQYLSSFQYDDCPNAAAIRQRISDSCRNGMRERVQLLNSDAEQVLAVYRKCQEFSSAHVRPPPPPGAGLDALPQPGPFPAPVPPTTRPAAGLPSTPSPMKDIARPPAATDTVPTLAQPPASSRVSCCERCPATMRDRYYVPMAPETNCQPGDARRYDLHVAEGTCANPLTEQPGPLSYGAACCAGKKDQLLYDSISAAGVDSKIGAALRVACEKDPCHPVPEPGAGPPTRLETSILSTGKDAHGRDWVPEHATLKLGKARLRPCHTESFYVTREAATRGAAAVFIAISAAYAGDAKTAEAAKGTSCHASEEGSRRETVRERATKAAALGLLVSQAKGQVKGLRATFDVTGRADLLKHAELQADVVNEITQQKTSLSFPVTFDTSE